MENKKKKDFSSKILDIQKQTLLITLYSKQKEMEIVFDLIFIIYLSNQNTRKYNYCIIYGAF